jgi:hypothetical protein
MKLYGREFSKSEFLKYVGNVSQIGGIEIGELTEGMSKGVRTVTVMTAEGLEYTVNPDCGMNISSCTYKGVPICWKTGTGSTNPGLYDAQLTGWLRTFNGGLLVTCGLSQIGAACVDEGVAYGLHGRISNTPAEVTSVKGDWIDDRYCMLFEGVVRESMALGQRLVLRRKIFSWLDSSEITVEDTIVNESWYDTPLLTSYHINFGYPFITESAMVNFRNCINVDYYNDASRERGLDDIDGCDQPTKGFAEQIYLQNLEAKAGFREFEVSNTVDGVALAVKISFSDNLNNLIHWRQFGEGDYVLGFEPANTTIRGRAKERADGNVKILKAQESVKYTVVFKFSRG